MGNMLHALIFVAFVNVFLTLAQLSADNLNPLNAPNSFNCKNTLLESTGADCTTYQQAPDVNGLLPNGGTTISPSTGSYFFDIIGALFSWIGDNVPGGRLIKAIASGPYALLAVIGLPIEVVWLFGTFWHLLTLIIIIAFISGRDY